MLDLEIKKYDLEENKAAQLQALYMPMLEMLTGFEDEFNKLVKKDITSDLEADAKSLRVRISKVRINADKARKDAKAEFLRAGNAIQSVYNTLKFAVESKEEKLKVIENHSANIEKERIIKLANERLIILQKYEPLTMNDERLGSMDVDVWDNYINGVKLNFDQVQTANKKAEADKLAAEKAEKERILKIEQENKRLAVEAEKAEKERDKLAKDQAKKDAEIEKIRIEKEAKVKAELQKIEVEKQRLIDIEKAKADKLAKELQAKKDAEIKAEQERIEAIEAKANQGDSDKVKALINDLEHLKTAYTFKSKSNQKMYTDFSVLINKVINHIKK